MSGKRLRNGGMSVLSVQMSVGDTERQQWAELSASVDVSNPVSFLPASLLKGLGVTPAVAANVVLANGNRSMLELGYAWLELENRQAMTHFVFDEENGQPQLGRVAINSLLLEVGQATGKLVPMTNLFL